MANIYFGILAAHWLIIISAILSLSGNIVYIRDMFRSKSNPNLISWGLWGVAPLISTGAALAAGADGWITVRTFMAGFGPLLVFFAAFFMRQGFWRLTAFDYVCGALAIIALCFWLLANSLIIAILLAISTDFLATLPTIIKAWKFPATETFYTYFIGLFTASIIIPAIPVWNIENAAFQIYTFTANVILFTAVARGRWWKKNL